MKNKEIQELLEAIRQDCYLDSKPESMLQAFQNAAMKLGKIKTRVELALDRLDNL